MKDYVKIILYAYPLLKTVGKDYEEHIRNRAITSYDSRWNAEQTAEYLAGEILQMRSLEWLKAKVEEALERLSALERTLVEAKYFGKVKGLKDLIREKGALGENAWTARTYFRRQNRLGVKLGAIFFLIGVTEEVYLEEFASLDIFLKISRGLKRRKDRKISAGKRRLLEDDHSPSVS